MILKEAESLLFNGFVLHAVLVIDCVTFTVYPLRLYYAKLFYQDPLKKKKKTLANLWGDI